MDECKQCGRVRVTHYIWGLRFSFLIYLCFLYLNAKSDSWYFVSCALPELIYEQLHFGFIEFNHIHHPASAEQQVLQQTVFRMLKNNNKSRYFNRSKEIMEKAAHCWSTGEFSWQTLLQMSLKTWFCRANRCSSSLVVKCNFLWRWEASFFFLNSSVSRAKVCFYERWFFYSQDDTLWPKFSAINKPIEYR